MSTPDLPETPEPVAADEPVSAATPAPSPEPEPEPEPEDHPSTWQPILYLKIGLLLFAIGYSIAFVVQNTDQISIDFVFWTAKVRLVWEILLLLAVGLVGGVLLSQLYRYRRRARLAKKAAKSGHAGSDVGGRDEAVGESR